MISPIKSINPDKILKNDDFTILNSSALDKSIQNLVKTINLDHCDSDCGSGDSYCSHQD